DGNGGLELVILSGADLYVFKSNTDNAYYLWYLKREDRKDAVTFHDFNRDGRMDFIISKRQTDSLGRGRFYAHAYLATGVVAVHEVLPLPTRVSLLQNYPNPFNPATIIEYTLAEAASVVLKVYNIAGQSVTTLVDEQRPPGRHVIIWNASEYPSGVYFYRLQAGDRTFTRKMLLVR
ncbi:MAG: T9SS type A sorting domain-containing protein, partial [Bacteroidota bacterium]